MLSSHNNTMNDPHINKLLSIADSDTYWDKRNKEIEAHRAAERDAKRARREERLKKQLLQIPDEYRKEFDPAKSRMNIEAIRYCKSWIPELGTGIGLTGTTGLGKTRLACAILRRLNTTHSWIYLPAFKMSNYVARQWDDNNQIAMDAETQLKRALRCDVLVLDDLGDERCTEASTSFLKELVEIRTSMTLPIIWTSNMTKEDLARRHGVQGAAVVRRLVDYSIIF